MNHFDESRRNCREDTYKVRFYVHGVKKTALITARDHKRAEKIADSFPHVAFVQKVDYDHIRNFEINEIIRRVEPKPLEIETNPLALKGMIWLRRNERRGNLKKEKEEDGRDSDS